MKTDEIQYMQPKLSPSDGQVIKSFYKLYNIWVAKMVNLQNL